MKVTDEGDELVFVRYIACVPTLHGVYEALKCTQLHCESPCSAEKENCAEKEDFHTASVKKDKLF